MFKKYLIQNSYVFFIIFILGLITYGNAIRNPFVHDDIAFIEKNPFISQLNVKALFDIFVSPVQTSGVINMYYRPLLDFIYRLEYKFFGLDAPYYHLVNILIHIYNSFLVFHLIKLIWPKMSVIPLTIAVIFLIHPLQTESVAYISGISDLVFSFFCLLSLNCYLVYRNQGGEDRGLRLYLLSLLAFIMALMGKEHSIILPFLIIFYEICIHGHSSPRKKTIIDISGYILILVAYFLFRKTIGIGHLTLGSSYELSLRIASIPKAILVYIVLFFFPYHLHFYRNHNILDPFILPLIGFLLFIILLAVLVKTLEKDNRRLALLGAGLFVIPLLPVINIIPLVLEYSYIFTAEHFMYFPIIGLLIFFSVIGQHFISKYHLKLDYRLFFAGIVICLVVMTMRQNSFYKNEVALFKRSVEFEPHLSRVHFLLAKAYQARGKFDSALSENEKAVKILQNYITVADPSIHAHYYQLLKNNFYDMAVNFNNLGDLDRSIQYFDKVVQIDPHESNALQHLGILYLKRQDMPKAVDALEKAVQINDRDLSAKNNLATAYASSHQKDKAKKLWQEILTQDPHFAFAQQNLERLVVEK